MPGACYSRSIPEDEIYYYFCFQNSDFSKFEFLQSISNQSFFFTQLGFRPQICKHQAPCYSITVYYFGRCYIYSCKYKSTGTSSIKYVNQVRCILRIEKHVSVMAGTQNAFQQRWRKILQLLQLPDLSFELLF